MKNEISFAENLIKIIEDSRNNALKKVNEELIQMYWNVGEYLSKEAEKAGRKIRHHKGRGTRLRSCPR